MAWCTHDRCKILEVHEEHPEDFAPARRKRMSKTAQAVAAGRPRVVKRVEAPGGPIALVRCPECSGRGCHECNEAGTMSLFRWHLWRKRC